MPETPITTVESLLAKYASAIARIAGTVRAADLANFIDQIILAEMKLEDAGIDGGRLVNAATHLIEAQNARRYDRHLLLSYAAKSLHGVNEMTYAPR